MRKIERHLKRFERERERKVLQKARGIASAVKMFDRTKTLVSMLHPVC